ncbi:MAG: DNA primase [Bacteroidota bacterium]|nr:DNA primase [Bacteroidota bacterium]MDP4230459.1 DNA primase [Bacteroidota bacterium]
MRTSDDIVERVRNATSIVDVVSEHVRLRKRGRNHIGLCPFHTEKTPSFNVVEDKGIFKCFGCGESGDVFSFLMKIEGLTFPEALAKLAKNAGIDYVRTERTGEQSSEDKAEPLIGACREFAAFCYRALRSDQGSSAREYLQTRQFSEEILKKFGVGFAPDGNASFLHSQEISNKTLLIYEQAGIISRGENGEYYDRFRNRIIFPIINQTGRIVGFGGRILPAMHKELAKYVNSPETPIYHKSYILYGLFQAKEAIRKLDYAIMVEGYADVLAVSQAGFENVIAAAGTSLTTDQLNLLRRYTKTIVLLFDADLAGKNAALRGIELALAADFDVSCIVLPPGEDPDSYLRKEGAEGFERQLAQKTSFIETKARLLKEQGLFESPEGAARAIRSLVETIAKVPDAIKQELYIRCIAERFQLMESTLLTELRKITGRERREEVRKKVETSIRQESGSPLDNHFASRPMDAAPSPAELELLRTFLENTAVAYKAIIDLDFDISLIENEYVKSVLFTCIRSYEENGEAPNVAILLEAFRDDEAVRKLIIDTSVAVEKISEEWENAQLTQLQIEERLAQSAHQSAAVIMSDVLEKKLKKLQQDIRQVTDEIAVNTIMEDILATAQQIKDLKSLRMQQMP